VRWRAGANESGGRVVGIIPEFIRQWEVPYKEADEMMVVTTMAERKILPQA
jgi:predicted Rossmann-fold nucleotide-binding protein